MFYGEGEQSAIREHVLEWMIMECFLMSEASECGEEYCR